MVVIRLARAGAKNNAFYHVVVTDRRNPRDGRFIERLGYFDPMARGKATRLELNQERIHYWISQGAQPSERVSHLIKEFAKRAKQPTEPAPTRGEVRRLQSLASKQAVKKAAAKKAKTEEAAPKEEKKKTEESKTESVETQTEEKQ